MTRRIRRYIRAKQKVIKLLKEQKQAIIHRAVTRGLDPNVRLKPSGVAWLGDVPEHWEVLRLGRVIELTTGFPFKSEGFTQHEDDLRLLRGVNISPGSVRWNDVVRWPRSERANYASLELTVGDIVLRMDRPIIQGGVRIATIKQGDLPSILLQSIDSSFEPSPIPSSNSLCNLINTGYSANYLVEILCERICSKTPKNA